MKKGKRLFFMAFVLFAFMPFCVDAMQISIRKPSQQEFKLEVESSDTIEAVKEKIYQVDNTFLTEKQKLFFNQREMEDGRTLADYNVQTNSTIYLEMKIKVIFDANGGTFGDSSIYTIDNWHYTLYDTLVKPTRDGYDFIGYYTQKTDGTSLEHYLAEAGIDNDMTFYARWEKQEKVPQTYDGIDKSILIAIISFCILICALLLFKIKSKRA